MVLSAAGFGMSLNLNEVPEYAIGWLEELAEKATAARNSATKG